MLSMLPYVPHGPQQYSLVVDELHLQNNVELLLVQTAHGDHSKPIFRRDPRSLLQVGV